MAEFEAFFEDEFTSALDDLDKPVKEIALKRIRKILENPTLSKPLHGAALRFSERFECYRIVFQIDERKIIFLKLGKRDVVYS